MKNPNGEKKSGHVSDVVDAAEAAGMPTETFVDETAGVSVAVVDVSKLEELPEPLLRIIRDQAVSKSTAVSIGMYCNANYSHTVTMLYQVIHSLAVNIEGFDISNTLRSLQVLHEATEKATAMSESTNKDKH